jgi:mannosyl-3-phosphoglycerate phosphatase
MNRRNAGLKLELMVIIFSDLDGTLLDSGYSFEAARDALDRLASERIPLALVSSKTRAEMEYWRRCLGVPAAVPYAVENGGAVVWENRVSVIGTPVAELRKTLEIAAMESGCAVRGFGGMNASEIASATGLSLDMAVLAAQREYDEPFEILNPDAAGELCAAVERCGKRVTRGGRFFHITGNNDKSAAVRIMRQHYPGAVSVGLGDAPNDAEMLAAVEIPVVLDSPFASDMLARLPGARAAGKGPAAWSRAVLDVLGEFEAMPRNGASHRMNAAGWNGART